MQISGSFFTSQLVKSIADEIRRIMKISFEIEALRADEEESSEGGGKCLPFEEVTQVESLKFIFGATFIYMCVCVNRCLDALKKVLFS